MDGLRQLINQERYEEAWQQLLEAGKSVTDYAGYLALCRWHRRLEEVAQRTDRGKTVKLAVLGGATTDMLTDPLKLAVESVGLGCRIYQAPYNLFIQEMLDPASDTAAFEPDVALLLTTPANMPIWPEQGDTRQRVEDLAQEACDHWFGLCERFHEHTPCEIVLNNFHDLPIRPLGNLGTKIPWDRNNFLRRVNLRLGDQAPSYVHINDVDGLSTQYGVRQWFDSRYWHHAKQPVSFECLVPFVQNTARIIGALFGHSAKCLVVDLDNTLWGGVVGDDGIEGIIIGEGDAVGEAFKAFQEYLLGLRQRGILLAVSSKNDKELALRPFEELPDMILKREDFVAFKANWDPKPNNLDEIARELNIGTNALVFVDDNPAEREIVRQWLPEVRVIELGEDPADFPRLVDDAGCFENVTLSDEDLRRVSQYQENIERQKLQTSLGNYEDYLESLEQRAIIRHFEEKHLDRITQLINKTNQFNLTTLRLSRSQVEERMRSPDMLTAYVRLADRFGDNGLISVLCAERDTDELWIQIWLMSCRVLKRGVERLLFNYVAGEAVDMGIKRIHGIYLPTEKNGLVRDHYGSLGFTRMEGGEGEESRWSMNMADFIPLTTTIKLTEDY